jgi:metal-responsive CopG/Arc/MetJ family transcriptional regulator
MYYEEKAMHEVIRVTIALPSNLWEAVKRSVPAGKRSRLVAEALKSELRRRQQIEQVKELHQFQDHMRRKYGEVPASAEEIAKMRQERDDEHDGLR